MSLARGNRKKDLHWFLRQIEQVIINVLAEYDLIGERDEAGTGVWVDNKKIAAIGLSASKWVTMHGFSFNVAPDMVHFDSIVACGIEGRGVTSFHCLNRQVDMDQVAQSVVRQFGIVFDQEKNTVHGNQVYPDCREWERELFQTLPVDR